MKNGVFSSLCTHISQTGQHVSGLRTDLRSRLDHFRRHRSAAEQQELTEDFSRLLVAWDIDTAADLSHVIRALRLRFAVFAVPVVICVAGALLQQDIISCLALAFVSLPCLFGIITTAWRISILKTRHFLPLSRWLLSGGGLLRP